MAEVLPLGSRATPCCGTSSAFWRTPAPSFARTYMPGISTWSGLGTSTRSEKLPVLGSTATSENFRLPWCANSLPSSSRIVTGMPSVLSRRPSANARRRSSSSVLDWVRST